MKTRVLGPLTVDYNGASIVPTAGKPRQILALLALRSGRSVPIDTLIEEVWADAVPRSATTTLQTYILQLRRRIADALGHSPGVSPKDVLSTSYGGYRLVPAGLGNDLAEFHDLSARGARALEAGDASSASALLGAGLGLWRGPALADVPTGPALALEVIGMEEARLTALEQRIEADLRLGRHSSLLAELRMLSAGHPLSENLCAQLMTALYRAGSPWRALEEFRQLRGRLHAELGVEPTPRLQRLHQAMLDGDPALDGPADSLVRYAS
ncbi:AfsR/SARP family transcriptional regulator [Streptomyces sp. NBC_00878]|uniref:AfsR/SARP family transcriptional regulator n=1 Tax=Streptomyces sp. NBC_00878 TaxID=2975854 RepID=UPI002250EAB4|nr:AfsR/SARP family transcriptional regulator [Streptomyces sp. NBC_00878]MCX4906894.1 AfsR/SARP family transcriptional regulator [Streptomyces sp. NBC_00878]